MPETPEGLLSTGPLSGGDVRPLARRPLRRRGLPSPYKGVRRLLFGSSSPPPSLAEDSSRREQTVAATSLDLSADLLIPSSDGRRSLGGKGTYPTVWVSPMRVRGPLRAQLRAVAHKRSPELQSLDLSRQRSPASRQRPLVPAARHARHQSPERPRSPARQRAPAHLVPDARQHAPKIFGSGRSARALQEFLRARAHETSSEPDRERSPLRTSSPSDPAPQLTAHRHPPERQRSPTRPRDPSPVRKRSPTRQRAHASDCHRSPTRPRAKSPVCSRSPARHRSPTR
ncbi:uncharacterized protein [Palaemon carinicauda]|uniref:uncharacterized protein n=1 Tax=Palaemon carinicauda TaxID=392227 RepID=UPI0035B6886A